MAKQGAHNLCTLLCRDGKLDGPKRADLLLLKHLRVDADLHFLGHTCHLVQILDHRLTRAIATLCRLILKLGEKGHVVFKECPALGLVQISVLVQVMPRERRTSVAALAQPPYVRFLPKTKQP